MTLFEANILNALQARCEKAARNGEPTFDIELFTLDPDDKEDTSDTKNCDG